MSAFSKFSALHIFCVARIGDIDYLVGDKARE